MKKIVGAGSARRKSEKESGSQARGRTTSGMVAHCFLVMFFRVSCLFLGELVGPWGSYLREIQTSISHNTQEEQKRIKVVLSALGLSLVENYVTQNSKCSAPCIIHAWETADNLCSHFIKHVTISPGLR